MHTTTTPTAAAAETPGRLATQCLAQPGPGNPYGAAAVPVFQTATFRAPSIEAAESQAYDYSRSGNPTRTALEASLAHVLGGRGIRALAVNSGMAATDAVVRLVRAGDHVLVGHDVYGGTHRLLGMLREFAGCTVHTVDTTDIKAVVETLAACAEGRCCSSSPSSCRATDEADPLARARTLGAELAAADTTNPGDATTQHPRHRLRLVLLESPTNPLMHVADLRAIAVATHALAPRALVVVDNTMASPIFQRPLLLDRADSGFSPADWATSEEGGDDDSDLDAVDEDFDASATADGNGNGDEYTPDFPGAAADIELHSATKYLGGHHDLTAGVIAARRPDLVAALARIVNAVGSGLAPWDCFLAARGLKTLHLRVAQQARSAAKLARWLARQPAGIKAVHVPSSSAPFALASTSWFPNARPQARGGSGGMAAVFSFETGSVAASEALCRTVTRFGISVSFGCVDSLVSMPWRMSHASIPVDQRGGVPADLVRVSVGIEDVRDLVADLRRGVKAAAEVIEAERAEAVVETAANKPALVKVDSKTDVVIGAEKVPLVAAAAAVDVSATAAAPAAEAAGKPVAVATQSKRSRRRSSGRSRKASSAA
ncbi:cystathionine beta-lyase [Blastocladiella emersonii ATCC 22665]|nr:cystathionine beta-lyase [Blastocladiella emersonii ATCC 22665]